MKFLLFLSLFILLVACQGQQNDQAFERTIENLTAFAKVYGHVKYFHPSDEAQEIDWDKFAFHGVDKVKRANDQEELIEILNSLFLPIAPTLRISSDNTLPEPFIDSYLSLLDEDTTKLKNVAWQHLGVELYDNRPPYSSRRLHADTRPIDKIFILSQSFNSDELSGDKIKLQATLKHQLADSNSGAVLSIKVNDEYYITEISDSIYKHAPGEWDTYEVLAPITPDTNNISIDLSVNGIGSFWIYDIKFKTQRDEDIWNLESVYKPIVDGNLRISTDEWGLINFGYFLYSVDSECPLNAETQCLKIDSPSQLFEQHPVVGETTIKELEKGLWSETPLALFHNGKYTLPQGNREQLKKLQQQLDNIYLEDATGDNENVRLANVIITWNIFQHFYPYSDLVDTDWDHQLNLAIQRALTDKTEEEFYRTLSKMLASLQDGHIIVRHPSLRNLGGLPFLVDLVENQIVVTHSINENFIPGDVIESVDGVLAKTMIDSLMHLVSGSPQYSLHRSLRLFGSGELRSEANINVVRESEVLELDVLRSFYSLRNVDRSHLPVIEEIEEGILFVDLVRASSDEINDHLDKLSSANGVVFDLRGPPNAEINLILLPHLLSEPDTSSQWLQTPQIIYPDQKKFIAHEKRGVNLRPLSPHIQGNIVFITDARAKSTPESFLSFVKHYEVGEIIGQPTAGANGNVNFVNLPGDYSFQWTGMKVLKHDGSQHHLIGIQPTVPVEKTIEGIQEGRDEFLEKAIKIIQSNDN